MTRTFWPLSAVVFATLLACNDDSGGQKASASGGSTTGSGDAPATATATASVPTTSGDSVSDGLTAGETTVNATLGTMTSTTTSGAVSASETLSDSGNSGITATAASETRGSDTLSSDSISSDTNNSDTVSSDTISSDTASGDTVSSDTVNSNDTLSGDTNNCGDTNGGPNGDTNGGPGDALTPCEGKIWACGDGIDNDGDGKIDNADVECISPCDNDEGSFQTDLPGQAEDCKNDCYWDLDSGAGQDKCEYDLKCDAKSPGIQIGCGYVEPGCGLESPQVPQPKECMDTCQPLAPNGCDCFGCCQIDGSKETYYLDASDGCSATNLDKCEPCTFQIDCANPCVGCEICFGQTEPPKGCDPGEGEQCPDGVKTCTMGCNNDCDPGSYCQTGCCMPVPL